MAGLTLDAGVLVAADRDDRRAWGLLALAARRRETAPVVPVAVLAQAWRDGRRQANLARFLRGCRVEALSEADARAAGELCGRAGTADVVDAAVVVGAARRGDAVITTDPGDLGALAAHAGGVVVVVAL